MPSEAKIEIGIRSDGVAHVAFGGNERLIIPLVGAMEQVKVDLISRAREKFSFGLKWEEEPMSIEPKRDLSTNRYDIYPAEQMLPRDKAIDATMYAIEALQLRIQSMRKCPPEQSFAVDHELLSKL